MIEAYGPRARGQRGGQGARQAEPRVVPLLAASCGVTLRLSSSKLGHLGGTGPLKLMAPMKKARVCLPPNLKRDVLCRMRYAEKEF